MIKSQNVKMFFKILQQIQIVGKIIKDIKKRRQRRPFSGTLPSLACNFANRTNFFILFSRILCNRLQSSLFSHSWQWVLPQHFMTNLLYRGTNFKINAKLKYKGFLIQN